MIKLNLNPYLACLLTSLLEDPIAPRNMPIGAMKIGNKTGKPCKVLLL